MRAFNYNTQQWETGAKAAVTRIKQLRAEIEILKSPRAAEYLRFIGSGLGKSETFIALAEAEIAKINAESSNPTIPLCDRAPRGWESV